MLVRHITSETEDILSPHSLQIVFNNIANDILETAMSVHVKSMTQEVCNV